MEKYQILIRHDRIGMVAEDWVRSGTGDLVLRMAKTEGCRVIETTDMIYAGRIVNYLRAAEKVKIVKTK